MQFPVSPPFLSFLRYNDFLVENPHFYPLKCHLNYSIAWGFPGIWDMKVGLKIEPLGYPLMKAVLSYGY